MSALDLRVSRGSAATPPLVYLAAGLVLGVIVAGGVALLAWPAGDGGAAGADAGGGMGGFGDAPPASPVDVVAAVEAIAAEPVQLLASAAPIRESLVASEVDGLVVGLDIDEGSRVRAGQRLATLRTADVEQQLTGARASLQETEARLARAESDYARFEALLERRAISQAEFDQATAERDALARAAERLGAEIARLDDQLDRAQIAAPFGGRVTAVEVEVGEWVGRGDPVARLVDMSEIEIQVQIPERFVAAVEPGFPVTVQLDAIPGSQFEGRVHAVVPAAVPAARTFPVLVRVANPDGRIKPGMAARMLAQLGDPEPVLLVAKDAIVRRGADVYVMKVAPGGGPGAGGAPAQPGAGMVGTIVQVPVVLGPARGQWQVVEGDVAAGDMLVVRGNERVFPGQPAEIANVRELPVPVADPDRPIATDPRSGGGA